MAEVDLQETISQLKEQNHTLAQLAAILNNIQDFVGVMDLEGNPLYHNSYGLEMLGVSPEDGAQMGPEMVHSPEDAEHVKTVIFPQVLREGAWRGENRLVHKDGHIIPVDQLIFPVYDGDDQLFGIGTIMRDTSARKQMEEAMRKLVRVSSLTIGSSFFESIALEFSRILKSDYTHIGTIRKGGKVVETIVAVEHGELVENFKYLLKGTPCELVVGQKTCTFADNVADRFPDDPMLKEMGINAYVGIPLFDSDCRPLGILVALFKARVENIDFTTTIFQVLSARVAGEIERLRAEQELRDRQKEYHSILLSSVDGFISTNHRGRILDCNQAFCQLMQYDRNAVLGMKIFDFDAGESATEIKAHFEKTVSDGSDRFEALSRRRDGEKIQVEISVTYLAEFGGRFYAYVRDLTERKQFEERLRQRDKMEAIGQLAGGVAHDFNNQLGGISGYAEMLVDQLKDPEHLRFARHIMNASRRAADLTRQLLAFARKGKYISTSVNLHEIMDEVIAILQRSIDKRIVIEQQLDAQTPVTKGDPTQLQNALLNLALNARDAMPSGGVLRFETRLVSLDENAFGYENEAGRYVEVVIEDTGSGMSDETRQHLFEPFYTTKQPGQGTGLGLAAVYGTVKHHLGAISVNSELGRGTIFKLYLPLEADALPAPVAEGAVTQAKEGVHLLLVDDEEIIRHVCGDMLKLLGYTVDVCNDGEEALELYRGRWQNIDLVILDMVMPRLSGLDTFIGMRAINPSVRALLATGYSIDGEAQAILKEGVLGFIQKPFCLSELSEQLTLALHEDSPKKID